MQDSQHQTGITTRQMRSAPQDSIYVWMSGCTTYPVQLARWLERTDLKIVGPSWVTQENILSLCPMPKIILDHATHLNDKQWDAWDYYLARRPL